MHVLRPLSILSLVLTAGAVRFQPLLPYTWDYIIVGTGKSSQTLC